MGNLLFQLKKGIRRARNDLFGELGDFIKGRHVRPLLGTALLDVLVVVLLLRNEDCDEPGGGGSEAGGKAPGQNMASTHQSVSIEVSPL